MTFDVRRAAARLGSWSSSPARSLHVYLVVGAIGLAVYLLVFGAGHMVGTSAHWDLPLQDSRAYLMGYRYFLHEPWHWPLFETQTMNVPYGKSIAFTDSIPLWAFLNKSLATVVPPWGTFSERAYLGLWYALVHVLQPCLGVACLRALGLRSWHVAIVGALFFVAIPVWTSRYVHASLYAQFLLLWAILLYLRTPAKQPAPRRVRIGQVVQLAVAALVNPYHTVFSLGVFVASVLRSRRVRELAWVPAAVVVIGGAAWLAGYFAQDAKLSLAGFDAASSNVLSMVTPWRSGLVGDALWVDPTGLQYEGIGYLGIGILVVLALFLPHVRTLGATIKRHPFLFALALGAWLFALSNHIYVGSHRVAAYSIPSSLSWVADQFRSPGRFIWVPVYVVTIFLLRWGFTRFSTGWKAWVLPGLAVLQLVDVSGDWRAYRANTEVPKNAYVDLAGWRPLVQAHDSVFILPSYDCILDGTKDVDQVSLDIQYLASERALPINGVYSARPTRDCAVDTASLLELVPRPGALYVFLKRVEKVAHRFEALGASCAAFAYGRVCSLSAPAITTAVARGSITPAPTPPTLRYGEHLALGDARSEPHVELGWSWPEGNSRWTDGAVARIAVRLDGVAPAGVALRLRASSVVGCGERAAQDVGVVLGGVPLGELRFDSATNDPEMVRALSIPDPGILAAPVVVLELHPRDVRTPATTRCNADPRQLGLSVRDLWFE